MRNVNKVVFTDGGERSSLLKILTDLPGVWHLSIPGDLSVEGALTLISKLGLEFEDQTQNQRVLSEHFLSGGPLLESNGKEDLESASKFYRSAIMTEENDCNGESVDEVAEDEFA